MKFSKINPGAESKYMGPEPSWTNQEEIQNLKVAEIGALNWYNYMCDNKQAKTFVIEYMASIGRPKEEISLVASSDASIPVQLGWVARMMCMGYQPSESFKNFFVKEFKNVVESAKKTKKSKAPVVVATTTAPVVSIQDRIREKASEEAGEIEGLVDDFIIGGCKSAPDMQSYLKSKDLSSVVQKKMCEVFIKRSKEFEEVMNTTDADIKEGYSNFSKVQLRKVKEFYDAIVAETNRGAEKKPTRKARKVKEKPASVIASKVQYMKDFAELNLKSVLPEKIIGANQVWLYNTKTKLLGMYNADNAKGLTIKGTTIQNFNTETSSGKRLRKPEVTVKQVLDGGKIVLKKLLDGLTTKPAELTGRINSDTIVVRVITG
jgi:hypothetical protein